MGHDPAGFAFADEPPGSGHYNPLAVHRSGSSVGVPMVAVQEEAEAAQNQLAPGQAVAAFDGAGAVGAAVVDADADAVVSRMCCMTGMTGQTTFDWVAAKLGSS